MGVIDSVMRHPIAVSGVASDATAIGIIGSGVPTELILAAGASPVRISPEPIATPRADAYVSGEPHATRALLERALDGSYAAFDLLIVTRQHEWLYYFLKEAVRVGAAKLPPLHIHDFVPSAEPMMRSYNLDQMRRLAAAIERATGTTLTRDRLVEAAKLTNLRRAALRELQDARTAGKLSGAAAANAIAASFRLAPADFATALNDWLTAQTPPPAGPRIVLLGGEPWHAAIEAAGAIVIAEDSDHGSRAVQDDVRLGDDPIADLLDATLAVTTGPDVAPRAARVGWAEATIARHDIDGVIFGLARDDRKVGWDYPGLRDLAASRGVPQLLVRDPAEEGAAIAAFVSSLTVKESVA